MPIAAVPAYLGKDFSQASPGLRFGMYLPVWGVDAQSGEPIWSTHDLAVRTSGERREAREFKDENKGAALRQAAALTGSDVALMKALAARQAALARTGVAGGEVLVVDARSTSPFTTGLGNEHPLENGFAFLNPYGLPYLAGSGVKGVVREAARQLAKECWDETHGWDDAAVDVLFGPETSGADALHRRGALRFRDVIPELPGNALHVEVMTPHQSHYLQRRPAAGSDSPHDSGQPNPITFLTVPPGSRFVFVIDCDLPFLARLSPGLAQGERWRAMVEAALGLAFDWIGFGAKAAVGYGAMARDEGAKAARERAAAEEAAARRRASLGPQQLAVAEFLDYMGQRAEGLRGNKERPNGEAHGRAGALARRALEDTPAWSREDRLAAAEAIEHWLPRVVSLPDPRDAFRKLRLRQLKGLA
jgi:CRISPR-associated protein Cmr6